MAFRTLQKNRNSYSVNNRANTVIMLKNLTTKTTENPNQKILNTFHSNNISVDSSYALLGKKRKKWEN